MTFDELHLYLREPSRLEPHHLSDLLALSRKYPYCASLHFLILTCLHRTGDLRFASELHRRILHITDPDKLFYTLKEFPASTPAAHTGEQLDAQGTESGFDLIDSFLEDHPEDPTEIEQMLDRLHTEDDHISEATTETTEEIIDDFLSKGEEAEKIAWEIPTEQPRADESTQKEKATEKDDLTNTNDDELFTETLARIYIRQGKYDQALRIFKSLNLKYSKKNSYFAEQIGFLEKLVRNSIK